MSNLLRALIRDERGQDLAEYGIALAVIVVAVALTAVAIGDQVEGLWENAQTQIAAVVG
jgi:Flp pilus assembly pilin Flp